MDESAERPENGTEDGAAVEPPVVLGQQFAAALDSERRLRARSPELASPLAARYDQLAGEMDLLRFVDSPTDQVVTQLVQRARTIAAGPRLESLRASLTLDDFYTLLMFARRSAVLSLRSNSPDPAALGVAGAALIDLSRIDWRDLPSAMAAPLYVLSRWPTSASDATGELTRLAQPEVVDLVKGVLDRAWTENDLDDWLLAPVVTRYGPGFADRGIDRYRPTVDLLDLGLDLADAIDADRYRTTRITLGSSMYPVWFPADRRDDVERHVARSRAGMVVTARPADDSGGGFSDHQFTVFVVELADAAASTELKGWSDDNPDAFHAALALAHGSLFALVVARSTVQGIENLETDASLRRFEPSFSSALASVPPPT